MRLRDSVHRLQISAPPIRPRLGEYAPEHWVFTGDKSLFSVRPSIPLFIFILNVWSPLLIARRIFWLSTFAMTFTTLRALHAAIGAAIDDIERVYREQSTSGPIEFPSLDEPYYYSAQHTAEEELAEALKGDPAVASASKRIVAACGQLATTVNKPWYGLTEDIQAVCFLAHSPACA